LIFSYKWIICSWILVHQWQNFKADACLEREDHLVGRDQVGRRENQLRRHKKLFTDVTLTQKSLALKVDLTAPLPQVAW